MIRLRLHGPTVAPKRSTWPATVGNFPLIRFLLDQGASLEARDFFKRTPLHWAIEANQALIVSRLLQEGADPNASDRIGKTALMFSLDQPNPGLVQQLLAAGADPKRTNFKGMTALHLAALRDPQALELLLDQGIDPDQLNSEGQSALLLAASRNPKRHRRSIKLLINRGANLTLLDNEDATVLDYSLNHNHLPLFEKLLDQGIDSDGLKLGKLKGRPAFIKSLIQRGRL